MKPGGLVAIACAVGLLSGCAAAVPFVDQSPLIPTDVASDSRPGFLDDPVDPERPLPAEVADAFHVDPAEVRYQGVWYGEDVYLSGMNGAVTIIGVDPADPLSWHTGGGLGNTPVAWESGDTTDDEWMLQYVPQGTDDLPAGWTAFSGYLAARDL